MEKRKYYYSTRFSPHVIEEAHNLFCSKLKDEHRDKAPQDLTLHIGDEALRFDSKAEFLAEYPRADGFRMVHIADGDRFIVESFPGGVTSVVIGFPTRPDVESTFHVFEKNHAQSKISTESDPIKIFIGHGRDKQWRDLKDHLHDLHGLDVVAYEVGPRAGLSIKEVLQDMLNASSFAILALTAEDQHADGEFHARENVIHELGLFQGRLGFTRAIALLEDEVKEFSNILGINQIRFSKGHIRETFGDILATIKREFDKHD